MKTLSPALASALFAAIALVPALASAQPSAAPPGPPPPPPPGAGYGGGAYGGGGYYSAPTKTPDGFQLRQGRLALGISFGLGAMESESGPVECSNCDNNPASAGLAFHIGGMISSRLALLLEMQGNAQAVEDYGYEGNATLTQSAVMGAAQFWVTPRIWLKGGLGVAHLQYNYSDDYDTYEEPVDTGVAVLAAAGIELLHRQTFSIDLQGRVLVGAYDGIDDQITASQIGVGFNWY
jgi:hypothetical protein